MNMHFTFEQIALVKAYLQSTSRENLCTMHRKVIKRVSNSTEPKHIIHPRIDRDRIIVNTITAFNTGAKRPRRLLPPLTNAPIYLYTPPLPVIPRKPITHGRSKRQRERAALHI